MPHTANNTPRSGAHAQFAATRWSVVIAAADRLAGTSARRALEELIQVYWLPLYAFIRRRGSGPQQAEDLTQGFFARFLEKDYLADVDRSKGKFRSFLLASLKHFLANEHDKAVAVKRGGGIRMLALDSLSAEARYSAEPVDNMTPERLFERRWALTVLEQVLDRLCKEYVAGGKGSLFDALKGSLADGSDGQTHADIGERLGMSAGAVKVAAHRLRKRYRELLRDEIAQTVASGDLVDEEIRHLLASL